MLRTKYRPGLHQHSFFFTLIASKPDRKRRQRFLQRNELWIQTFRSISTPNWYQIFAKFCKQFFVSFCIRFCWFFMFKIMWRKFCVIRILFEIFFDPRQSITGYSWVLNKSFRKKISREFPVGQRRLKQTKPDCFDSLPWSVIQIGCKVFDPTYIFWSMNTHRNVYP